MLDWPTSSSLALLMLLVATPAMAESAAEVPRDRHDLSAHSETHAQLFQRALMPGPKGALVSTDTAAPVTQYLSVRARDVDLGKQADSLDFEVSAWGKVNFGPHEYQPLVDGDVQSANVRYHHGALAVRLGRQLVAGGAARYFRFDGATVNVALGAGLSIEAYGGLSVLPRWNHQPGYEHLGASVDNLVKNPEALPDPNRLDYRAVGGRIAWVSKRGAGSVSFHDQQETGGLAHQNLGFDARADLVEQATLGAKAVWDMDRARFSDVRFFVDARPIELLDVSLEYLHTEPGLFLSHQSVLSVFGSQNYDEMGTLASVRATDWLTFSGSGYVDFYGEGSMGARAEGVVRVVADRKQLTTLRLAYARVQTPDNGYNSLRSSLTRRFLPRWSATLEGYAYLYDHAIRSYLASLVYASTVTFEPARGLSVLLGGSLASTPYASLDAQAQLRVAYVFDPGARSHRQ